MSNNYYKHRRIEVFNAIKTHLPKQITRALEIGCGEVGFSENLSPNTEYWGIEPSTTAIYTARKKLNKVFNGYFEDFESDLPANSFDLIICNDVIEHMMNPEKFLFSAHRILKKNGIIIRSIPNVRYWENLKELLLDKDWRYKEAGILDRTHLKFFTKKSLERTLAESGYEIIAIHPINTTKLIPSSIKKIIKIIIVLIFGPDTRSLQFAFAAKISPDIKS